MLHNGCELSGRASILYNLSPSPASGLSLASADGSPVRSSELLGSKILRCLSNLEISNVPFRFSEGLAVPVETLKLFIEIIPKSLVCIAIRPVVNREIAVRFSRISEKFSSDVTWSLSEQFGPRTVSPVRGFKFFDSRRVGPEFPDIAEHNLQTFPVCCLTAAS